MLSNFEANNLKSVKELLQKDLRLAKDRHTLYEEKQKELVKKSTLWGRIKAFFGK